MPKYIKNIKLVIFDVNETMFSLANISYLFKNFGLPPHTSDLWFSNVLKKGLHVLHMEASVPLLILVQMN